MNRVRIAACQYPVEFLADWEAFEAKVQRLVADACRGGAKLLLFPEYGSMELASLLSEEERSDLQKQLVALQPYLARFQALFRGLACHHGVYIVAPSFPVHTEANQYRNRAFLFSPAGGEGYQDKRIMTRFENETWGIAPGGSATVFDTDVGRIAIAICYDSEFPLLVRDQVAQGAEIILVPSCTDTEAGYYRVRWSAQARAIENQCFVVQSPTAGEAPWSPAVDVNTGLAGVFCPADIGFPADGVLALGKTGCVWTFATLDLEQLRNVRTQGQVLNHRDWERQQGLSVQLVDLN